MNHEFKVEYRDLDWRVSDPFHLWLWGDVHYDTPACDRDRFNRFVRRIEPGDFSLGLGDYHDFASAREQKALQHAGLHETTISGFDGIVEERNREFCNAIKPMRGNLLGLIGGNHTWRLTNGKWADEDLAERMGAPYLGWLCVYGLQFRMKGTTLSRMIYIVACHGQGGGKLYGTSINKVNDLKAIFPFGDIFVMGHDHQRGAWPTATIWAQNKNGGLKLKEKRQYLVRSGSFMKSYEQNESQYTTAGLMKPADLGAVKITIRFSIPRNGKGETKQNRELVHEIESTV